MSGDNQETFQIVPLSLLRVRNEQGLQEMMLNQLIQIAFLLNSCRDLFRIALSGLVMHNIFRARSHSADAQSPLFIAYTPGSTIEVTQCQPGR